MQLAILDTDVLSQLLKQKNPHVVAAGAQYLQVHGQFALSSLTRYEVMRGLKYRNAATQLARFVDFCRRSHVFPITENVLTIASDIWVIGRREGKPHRDADLIIAATALAHRRALVTANTMYFDWIPGLTLENWTRP